VRLRYCGRARTRRVEGRKEEQNHEAIKGTRETAGWDTQDWQDLQSENADTAGVGHEREGMMSIELDHVKEVTARAAAEGAYKRLRGREHVAVFIRHTPLPAGKSLRIGYHEYSIDRESYLVFVDLMHEANFAHPVLYELHSLEDGTVRTIEEEFPIADPELERSLIPYILPGKEGS
jgi:hypothetical protein